MLYNKSYIYAVLYIKKNTCGQLTVYLEMIQILYAVKQQINLFCTILIPFCLYYCIGKMTALIQCCILH